MIKIFIPCYKRLATLRWVLISLFNALNGIENNAKIFIVNNNPSDKRSVENLLTKIKKNNDNLNTIIIHREKELPPIYSWYSAIEENTQYGDIVFLHGDDDLFLFDSIKYRIELIKSTNSDIIISNYNSGLVFNKNAERIVFESINKLYQGNISLKQLTLADEELIGAIFIGNNCYRYNHNFKKSLELAFRWCDEQDWVDKNIRTQFLPFYLPLAAIHLGFKVYYSNKICVLRGSNIYESLNSKFGVMNWNPGFISLLCLGILNNKNLSQYKELDLQRKIANKMAAEWFWTYYFDHRINSSVRKETFKRIGYPLFNLNLIFNSSKSFIKYTIKKLLLGIWKIKKFKGFNKRSINTEKFIENLKNINA